MSSTEQNPTTALEEFRSRHQEYIDARDRDADYLEIDIDDLIGARGKRLELTAEQVDKWTEHTPLDRSDPNYWTPNMSLTGNGADFHQDEDHALSDSVRDDPKPRREVTGRILGRLASRRPEADDAFEHLRQAVAELREPLRTVAVNCLFFDTEPEEAARSFGTSVETIDFLTELALDQMASRIKVTLT